MPQFCGRLAANYTPAQKPFRALLHMISIRIGCGCVGRRFLRALTLGGQTGK
jgi:hypothetical protein